MKENITSVYDASFRSGLSVIQIYILYRNGVIKAIDDNIDYGTLKKWIKIHRPIAEELRKDVDNRYFKDVMSNYLLKTNRRKES